MRVQESQQTIKLLTAGNLEAGFIPWQVGEEGQQAFLKLVREDETAYLYAGVGGILEVEIQKALMRLLNDGWALQGEVFVSFDGNVDPGAEAFVSTEPCMLEIGSGLLPLVDPYQNAPLLERLPQLRREIAEEIGFTAPGIKVRDDMRLPATGYRVRLRGAVAAQGEIFTDRFLAVGSLEQLGALQGWSTTDPSYRLPAKWILPTERETAEKAGCMLFGSLAVLLTHLREVIKEGAPELLGLQETHTLLSRLRQTHPIVVEDFLPRIDRVRKVRHVLRALLAEGVSIGNLVTILETLGDHLDQIDDVEGVTERVRVALARQIATRYVDEEGRLRALVLSDDAEDRLRGASGNGAVDGLSRGVREALEEHHHPSVLFVSPPLRRAVRRHLEAAFPHLAVLSTAEIPPGLKVEVAGPVYWSEPPAESPPPPPPTPADEEKAAFWKTRKRKSS